MYSIWNSSLVSKEDDNRESFQSKIENKWQMHACTMNFFGNNSANAKKTRNTAKGILFLLKFLPFESLTLCLK